MSSSRSARVTPLPILLALAGIGLIAAACASVPEASPTPQPPLPLVAVTPSLEPLVTGWLASYAEAEGVPEFDLTIRSLDAAEEEALAERIVLIVAAAEAPSGWFATPLGREGLAVIVHPENSVRAFDLEELGAIFSGEARSWDALGGQRLEVQPVIPIPGDELRTLFVNHVMGTRRLASSARLAASPELMADLVAEAPGRIGVLPWSAVDERVLASSVDGMLPSDDAVLDGTYPLTLQVIALAPEEPQGPVRDWLVWMQSRQTDG
jgi:ABC-type phosphate transport system substrate-binding protein